MENVQVYEKAGLCRVKLECQSDLQPRGVFWSWSFREVGDHVLSLREIQDDVIVNENLQALFVDLEHTDDAAWIDLEFLRDLHRQVLDGSFMKVDGMVVFVVREMDVQNGNYSRVSVRCQDSSRGSGIKLTTGALLCRGLEGGVDTDGVDTLISVASSINVHLAHFDGTAVNGVVVKSTFGAGT